MHLTYSSRAWLDKRLLGLVILGPRQFDLIIKKNIVKHGEKSGVLQSTVFTWGQNISTAVGILSWHIDCLLYDRSRRCGLWHICKLGRYLNELIVSLLLVFLFHHRCKCSSSWYSLLKNLATTIEWTRRTLNQSNFTGQYIINEMSLILNSFRHCCC